MSDCTKFVATDELRAIVPLDPVPAWANAKEYGVMLFGYAAQDDVALDMLVRCVNKFTRPSRPEGDG